MRQIVYLLALAVGLVGILAGYEQVEIQRLQASASAPAAAQTASDNPCKVSGAACVVTPYARNGLVLQGSRGVTGGTPLDITDHEGSMEMWVTKGNLYLLSKHGWEGGAICFVNARADSISTWRTQCLTFSDVAKAHRRGI